jgi:uncharacterized protein YhbP (UPF0306 family)
MLTNQRISEFLKSTALGMALGTRDTNLKPDFCRVLGIQVVDPDHLRFFIDKKSNPTTFKNLQPSAPIALTTTRADNFESYQFKGKFVKLTECSDEDNQAIQAYLHEFNVAVVALGLQDGLVYNYPHSNTYALEMEVKEIFEQTPKPGTGNKL